MDGGNFPHPSSSFLTPFYCTIPEILYTLPFILLCMMKILDSVILYTYSNDFWFGVVIGNHRGFLIINGCSGGSGDTVRASHCDRWGRCVGHPTTASCMLLSARMYRQKLTWSISLLPWLLSFSPLSLSLSLSLSHSTDHFAQIVNINSN